MVLNPADKTKIVSQTFPHLPLSMVIVCNLLMNFAT